jgi:hypothetical protein
LTSLDRTIREGNSIISDKAVHPKAFDWQAAFPEVFAQGGFDVVMGFRLQPVLAGSQPRTAVLVPGTVSSSSAVPRAIGVASTLYPLTFPVSGSIRQRGLSAPP